MYQKSQSHDVQFLRYRVRQTEFFAILDCFLHFTPPTLPYGPGKSKFWKNKKNTSYYHFTNVYHKWQSYDVWLQHKKSKFWKNKNTAWRYYHFIQVWHKWQSYDVWFLRYGVRQRIFCHFGLFFALLPP